MTISEFNQEDNSDRTAINGHGAFPKSDRFVAGLALGNAPYQSGDRTNPIYHIGNRTISEK
ncbi:hypothetical protein [Microcystis aeruginosa]|nr:hypothetical protein [Microcystis aeruginosa]